MSGARHDVVVDGQRLSLSNLDKVLFPETGLTKAGVIDYYRRIAPALLPHLRDRALTLRRFPDGVDGESFFEKNCPGHRPPWVRTADVEGRSSEGTVRHCLIDDLPGLVWLANLAALELHVPMACVDDLDHPTAVVFDLDPGPPAGLVECASVALVLRDLLGALDLAAHPKTSGQKGLHVYVPLGTPAGTDAPDHGAARAFARAVAELVARRSGGLVVTRMDRNLRAGKVFIDWSQNARHKTTVGAYSLRAVAVPAASTPVRWSEIEEVTSSGRDNTLRFTLNDTLTRVETLGDLFEPVLGTAQTLPRTTPDSV